MIEFLHSDNKLSYNEFLNSQQEDREEAERIAHYLLEHNYVEGEFLDIAIKIYAQIHK
jgi:hypothetical protein